MCVIFLFRFFLSFLPGSFFCRIHSFSFRVIPLFPPDLLMNIPIKFSWHELKKLTTDRDGWHLRVNTIKSKGSGSTHHHQSDPTIHVHHITTTITPRPSKTLQQQTSVPVSANDHPRISNVSRLWFLIATYRSLFVSDHFTIFVFVYFLFSVVIRPDRSRKIFHTSRSLCILWCFWSLNCTGPTTIPHRLQLNHRRTDSLPLSIV